ncbi:MAG: PKD domain-containing protein, partial [Chitinophagaceae bacterium]
MKKLILLFIFTLIKSATFAQLVADFTTVDGKEGGCSPLAISFKNTTQGASINATYKWDLGNQNFSTLQHPGTVYTVERTYQVTLTVTDGTSTSTKTKTIIVYKKPVVDFVVTNGKGCAPLVTTFNSLATPGDGRITRYFWDFGDGVVAQDTNLATIQHTYTFAKKAKIDLVVTNSFGCQNTIRKDTLVEIKNKVSVNFSANNTALCNTTQQVQFNNNSNGPGNVTYSWNFGDGQTSAEKNPIHQYAQNGKYTVRLTVNSSFGKGCDNQLEQKDFIKIADFGSSISVPTLICTGSSVTFSAINSANPTATNWSFSDNNFATASSNNTVSKTFQSVGNYIVRLINTYGSCKDTVLRNVMVSKGISLNGFLVNAANACNIPSTVYFEDTTKAAVKWSWNFNTNVTGAMANTKAPAYAYRNEGNYPVELTIENVEGCKAKTTKQVVIKKANVTIQVLKSSSSNGLNGCPGLSVTFATISSTNIKQYEWSFGDGFTSNSIQPTHIYQKVGVFSVKLKYTTIDGCIDSTTCFENIKIYQKPKANFTVSNNIVCGNNPVVFTNTSTPISNKWFWDFGDKNTSPLSTNNHVVSHKYLDSGYFSVRLIAVNEACADTIDKIRFIQVTPPFTKITNISNTCKNNRGEVIFTFTTKGATKFEWDFGDGNSKTIEGGPKPVIHTYAQSGRYNVKLKAFSVACTVEDGGLAQVLLKNHPSLAASKSQICLNDSIQIKISNLQNNPSNTGYEVFKVENKTGNTSSAKQRPITTKWTNEYVAHLSSIPRGTDSVRFILQSNQFNCYDTTNFISITSSGPIANFNIQTKTPCFKEAVTFNDLSTADSGAPIKKWEWFFGDAKTSVQTQSISIQYQYANPGLYQPVLKVTDANGCFAINANAHKNFEVKGPKAAFTYAPSIIAPNLPVTFTNASNIFGNTSVQYNWQFSVGKFASNSNTTVTRNYANSVSKDTVTLVVRDQASKCSDTAIQVITLKRMDLNFTFSTEYLSTNDCPPLLAKFVGKSSNAQFITWNFGDNSSASNINSPSHTYHQPGIYTITMYGYGENNLIDSVSKQIEIKGPYASLFANSYNNCTPAKLTLGAKA